jgi:hypothetical protein
MERQTDGQSLVFGGTSGSAVWSPETIKFELF